jgi:TRAP-type C4-dicarboxylate transport system permease small subunit
MRRVQVLLEGGAGQVSTVRITEKIWSALDKTITAMMVLGAAIIIIDMLAVSVDVILRYILGITYTGLFEIMEYSLLWITFLATAWLLKINGHIRLDLILDRLNPRRKVITNIATSVICEILMGFLIWYSVKLLVKDFIYGTYLSTVLQPVKWPIEIIIAIGYILLFIVMLRRIFELVKTWQSLSSEKPNQTPSTPGGEMS